MPRIVPFEEMRFSETAALFEGGDTAPLSIFVTEYERGRGVGLHVHPYPEVFVVLDGAAEFQVADERLTVEAGHVVVVEAETPHGFSGAADVTTRVVSVHPSGAVQQTFL